MSMCHDTMIDVGHLLTVYLISYTPMSLPLLWSLLPTIMLKLVQFDITQGSSNVWVKEKTCISPLIKFFRIIKLNKEDTLKGISIMLSPAAANGGVLQQALSQGAKIKETFLKKI